MLQNHVKHVIVRHVNRVYTHDMYTEASCNEESIQQFLFASSKARLQNVLRSQCFELLKY